MPRLSIPNSLFGRRLREARNRAGIAQDKLGVVIGMDEGSSSARISRYETGTHEPPFATAEKLAAALGVPAAYFYCDDDRLAEFLIRYTALEEQQKAQLLMLASGMSIQV
jgi:transcriptional regulator with XRE-family HTH domain